MQNFLGTCLALGILAGGLLVTGDMSRLAARALRVIQSTDVPDHDAPVPVTAPARPTPGPATPADPPGPRGGTVSEVDLTALAPGSRVIVWLGVAGRVTTEPARRLMLDVVDPTAREALACEAEWPPSTGPAAIPPAPPRRVRTQGSGAGGVLVRGGTIELEPRGIAGAHTPETFGPVVGLETIR